MMTYLTMMVLTIVLADRESVLGEIEWVDG
jgi:hypothetical protein